MPKAKRAAARDRRYAALHRSAYGDVAVLERACPHCGDPNGETPAGRYSLGQWTMKTCRGCSLTYLDRAPDYEALFSRMSWDKTTRIEEEWRRTTWPVHQYVSKTMRWRMRLLPRKTMPDLLVRHARPGRVVDLGCGDGGQLHGLDDRFTPFGIEISREAAGRADAAFRKRGGRAINAPSLEGLKQFPDGFFSAATLRSYLEHELRPAEVMRELCRTLEPGGVALVKVPNYACLNRIVLGHGWPGFRYPDHLNYFTPATLRAMAESCGFRVSFGMTWRLPTSDNMYAALIRP